MPAQVEILPVAVTGGGLWSLRPVPDASWRLPSPEGEHPGTTVVAALADRGLRPAVVHSTSWRYEAGGLVLTYVAALTGDGGPRTSGLLRVPVRPRLLARGGATTPPASLDVDQVLHHALRHLAWLEREDADVAAALDAAWLRALAGYVPAPFDSARLDVAPAGAA